ncbi:hypothetical protein TNCV_1279211 [Trichonephila clavipes]|nr:hypothetical protein TNCV_1279211 [Trichonephila clavipes]
MASDFYHSGSLLFDNPNAGSGVISEIYSFYVSAGGGIAFDGDSHSSVPTAAPLGEIYKSCDPQRFQSCSVGSDNNLTTHGVLDCCHDLKNLASLGKTKVLQWILAYCGVPGNVKVDFLAKKGVLVLQQVSHSMSSYSVSTVAEWSRCWIVAALS